MTIEQRLAEVIQSCESLTATVEQTIDKINARVLLAETEFQNFQTQANRKYLGTLSKPDKVVTAHDQEDVYDKLVEAYRSGHQFVQLEIPENTTCYLNKVVSIPAGCGLMIQGADIQSSVFEAKRKTNYQDGDRGVMINTFYIRAGSSIVCNSVQLKQKPLGGFAAPYGHGIFLIDENSDEPGSTAIKLRECKADIYDCLVYFQGNRLGMVNIQAQKCDFNLVDNQQWFQSSKSAGLIGLRSWSDQGAIMSFVGNDNSFDKSSDTEKVCHFIEAFNSGKDLTSTLLATPASEDRMILVV
ncbi:hypothetical protein [Algicola sagamiensis]|uniref:hypothetical protein n=1 Tax=Algicola sagamiensis TaxID=163869 RepID=UPI000376CC45|nr:hypothetical protein [Algicola sagamiensis]